MGQHMNTRGPDTYITEIPNINEYKMYSYITQWIIICKIIMHSQGLVL